MKEFVQYRFLSDFLLIELRVVASDFSEERLEHHGRDHHRNNEEAKLHQVLWGHVTGAQIYH